MSHDTAHIHGVQHRMISVDNFFIFFEIIIFCCVVAICDLVHVVETILLKKSFASPNFYQIFK